MSLPSHRIVTLSEVWASYKETRKLRPTTIKGYQSVFERCFADWHYKPVASISKQMIEERHRQLSSLNSTRGTGRAQANLAMRFLRALLTFASYKFEDDQGQPVIVANPVRVLSVMRSWNEIKPRSMFIDPGKMPGWFVAVRNFRNQDFADFLIFLMLTGFRRREATLLKWSDIDFAWGVVTVRDTKNGKDHRLPLSDYLLSMLQRRRARYSSDWVFPGESVNGHIGVDCRMHQRLFDELGYTFTPHDLRRTFITIADGFDFPDRIVKALINHKAKDVTEKYIQRNVERLRGPMQQITDEILRQAKLSG